MGDAPVTTPPAPPAEPGAGAPAAPSATERTISEAEMQRIATREKNEGKQAGLREAMTALGVDSLDKAKELLDAARSREDAERTEAQRAEAAAAERERKAEERETRATQAAHDAQVDRLLLRAGVTVDAKPEDPDYDAKLDARLERLRRMVTVEVGAGDDAIRADVAQLKQDFPDLFKAAPGAPAPGSPPAPPGDPGGAPPKGTQSEDAYQRGQERALARLGKTPAAPT